MRRMDAVFILIWFYFVHDKPPLTNGIVDGVHSFILILCVSIEFHVWKLIALCIRTVPRMKFQKIMIKQFGYMLLMLRP